MPVSGGKAGKVVQMRRKLEHTNASLAIIEERIRKYNSKLELIQQAAQEAKEPDMSEQLEFSHLNALPESPQLSSNMSV